MAVMIDMSHETERRMFSGRKMTYGGEGWVAGEGNYQE